MSATTSFREALTASRETGQRVRIMLRSGVEVRGTVASLDAFTVELHDGGTIGIPPRTVRVVALAELALVETRRSPGYDSGSALEPPA